MKKVLTIAWKDALIQFSSRSQLLFFIILPLAFTFILGGGFDRKVEDRLPLLVVNNDGGPIAAQLLEALAGSATLQLVIMDDDEAQGQFENGQAPALLTIPAGLEETLLQGDNESVNLTKAPNDLDADVIQGTVSATVGEVGRSLAIASSITNAAQEQRLFSDPAAKQAFFTRSLALSRDHLQEAPPRYRLTIPNEAGHPEANTANAQASAGQLLTWVLIPLLGTSVLLAHERTRGTLGRLVTTPTEKATYLLGTITGQFGLALIQMTLLVLFGVFVMKVDWGNSIPGLALILATFGLAAVAFGTFLGTLFKTESQAQNASIMLGMVLALLGGAWFPLEIFPPAVRSAVLVLPTTWAMRGFSDLLLRGQGFGGVFVEGLILLAFASLFFILGVRRFRYE